MNNVIEVGFNYAEVEEICRDDVRDAAVRIKVRMARTAQDIIEIGRDLIAVKKALGHGHFLRWIEAEFGMTIRTAQRFVSVAENIGDKYDTVSHLNPKAIYELAAPNTPDEVVEEVTERSANGESFTAADIKALKEQFASERRDLKKQVEDAKFKAKDAKATTDDFTQQMQAMRDELAALRDQRDTLEHELKSARSAPRPAPTVARDDTVEKQIAALMAAWNKAGFDARQEFLGRIGFARPSTQTEAAE